MRFSTGLRCAVASAAILAGAPAAAQSVDRIVAFGDSYADDGNLFELLGIPRPAIYPNGRFSNGTNFVDTMGQLLGAPIDNFAIGGAFTNNGNINGPGIPGFVTEYQSFLAGGGPAAFPRVSGTFDANDLLVISIGGNDARFFRLAGGTVAAAPAAAAISVAEASAGLTSLVGAGARNITYLAGDVGRLPEAVGTPSAAAGTAFSSAFNNGMQTTLAGFANQGVIVNYLDGNKIGDVVQANLAAFGLISADACPVACVTTNPALLDQYLFYVDRVHLTSRGFEIFGQYAVRQLEAPLHLQAQTDTALLAATAFASTMQGRLDLSKARNGGGDRRLHVFVQANAANQDVGGGASSFAYEIDTVGVTAGVEYDGDGTVFGAAVNYSRPEGDIVRGSGGVEGDALQGGLYGGWAQAGGGGFVQAHVGYGRIDLEIERAAVIDEIEGEADADLLTAGAKAGYLFGGPSLRFGPIVGVHYARAEIDGYTEEGDPALTLNVSEQDLKVLVGSLGVEARGSHDVGGLGAQPYVALTAEKDFEGDSRRIRYALTAAPTIVNNFVLEDRSKETYGRIAGGVNFALGGAAALQIHASTSVWRDGGEDMSGFVGFKLGF